MGNFILNFRDGEFVARGAVEKIKDLDTARRQGAIQARRIAVRSRLTPSELKKLALEITDQRGVVLSGVSFADAVQEA